MSVGDNIKKRRYELRMSQQELANAMGYKTRSTIAKIESGENDVSQKKLQHFARVLDTTVEALISGYRGSKIEELPLTELESGRGRIGVIILAGGKTGKNQQSIPSQFINIHGKPILVYSMEAYQAHPAVDDIYVVCLKGWENIVRAYAKQFGITKLRGLVPGGNSGVASLKNGLDYIKKLYGPDDLILVQESTRPMVTVETISRLLQATAEQGSGTICHSMRDYVQFSLKTGEAEYLDRNAVIALQSPEAHRFGLMQKVFESAKAQGHPLTESCFTMLLCHLGYKINFVESDVNNIKVTREEDLTVFSALVKP
ncbi:MAG: XRE family transcriptional regulator [Clostridia bacterium]|nr:XRE family transcriptional regulator [Clostridia bacterium]